MLFQLIVMFGTAFLGQVISKLLPFPFPGTVIASLILFGLLESGIVKLDQIKDVSSFSNTYLAIFFVPVGVGVMEYFSEFEIIVWLKILAIIIISTAATMIVTGKASDIIIGIQERILGGKHD